LEGGHNFPPDDDDEEEDDEDDDDDDDKDDEEEEREGLRVGFDGSADVITRCLLHGGGNVSIMSPSHSSSFSSSCCSSTMHIYY